MKIPQLDPEIVVDERLKEELMVSIVQDLKMARYAEGILSVVEIANAIKEGMGDDAPVLSAMLQIITSPRGDMFKEQLETFKKHIDKALGK